MLYHKKLIKRWKATADPVFGIPILIGYFNGYSLLYLQHNRQLIQRTIGIWTMDLRNFQMKRHFNREDIYADL
jgi:hypothetical protein